MIEGGTCARKIGRKLVERSPFAAADDRNSERGRREGGRERIARRRGESERERSKWVS